MKTSSTHDSNTQSVILDMDEVSRLNLEPVIPELIEPLLSEARDILQNALDEKTWEVDPAVFGDLIGWYEKMIARISNSLLIQRYSSFFLTVYPFWRPKDSAPGDSPLTEERKKLDDYISWEKSQELFSDVGPYSELNRLIKLAQTNWINTIIELFERISLHASEISRLMSNDICSITSLRGIIFGISDPHNDGRTAAIIKFKTQKVIYKPRSLDGEFGWNYILEYLISNEFEYSFYMPQILRFQGYGFMEFVYNTPCDNINEVNYCYEKYGALIAIAHAFGTYDLHHENIIVAKDNPIVIDAEPLFRCILNHSAQGENRLKLDKTISLEDIDSKESVIDIGMLPYSMINQLNKEENKYEDYIVGSLHPFGIDILIDHVPCGRGSDNLQMLKAKMKCSSFPNLPILNNTPQLPKDHIEQIEHGFKKAHTFLLKNRTRFISESLLFEKLENLRLRLLVRPTLQYGLIFLRSISAQLLNDHERRKQKIVEDLRLLGKMRLDDIGQIESMEVNSILNGDIPRFEVLSNNELVYNTPLMFSPLKLARKRYERLNDMDLELQLTTIREKIVDRTKVVSESKNKGLEPQKQLNHAFEIIQSIVDTTRSIEKVPYWTFTAYAPGYGSTMVHADREALYDGCVGTAVAIAEAARLDKNERWMEIAKSVFKPILNGETPMSIFRGGGMARGLGGLIYGMLRISDASGDEEFIKAASTLAVKYSNSVIEKEKLDEVLHGRSGFLLAMIALYKRNPSIEIEEIISQVANSLMSRAVSKEKGICWNVLDGSSLPNMSHGTSGISMALARWYEISRDPQAKEIVQGAIKYDNSFWDEEEKGWIDARVIDIHNEQSSTWTWCNGRSGALLSRLAISQAMGTSFMQDIFVKKAFEASMSDILHETSPGLCCGTPGVVDSLLKVNEYYNSNPIKKYIDKAVNLISLHSMKSHYSNLTPALFTGTAGLVFSLLRAAQPDKVPSLLWFE